jgi:protein-L-isoaspartate(D-aspartate) O-methyltransferase
MVREQIEVRGVTDPLVLEAMREVPREVFVDRRHVAEAYDDGPLPIGEDQTISQPYIVALMAELMELDAHSRVLEIGTGCGYAAAVYAQIATRGDVFTIERHEALVMDAARRLTALGYDRVHIRHGDGRRGWIEAAPFDAIAVAAAAEDEVPPALLRQLKIGGRILIPIGADAERQSLYRITRTSETGYQRKDMGGVRFVPLVG